MFRKNIKFAVIAIALFTCLLAFTAFGQSATAVNQGEIGYKPTLENLRSREWFQDAKFGLFIH